MVEAGGEAAGARAARPPARSGVPRPAGAGRQSENLAALGAAVGRKSKAAAEGEPAGVGAGKSGWDMEDGFKEF